jgi:hypothetical protein
MKGKKVKKTGEKLVKITHEKVKSSLVISVRKMNFCK